jgi:hypothetical protein
MFSLPRRTAATLAAALALAISGPTVAGAASAGSATGLLRITVTAPDGSPAQGLVAALDATGLTEGEEWLDPAGVATVDLPAGFYKLKVVPIRPGSTELDHDRAQYVPGKVRLVDATAYQLTAGSTLAVTERLLAPGTVVLTARNSVDGSPVSGFCARIGSRELCSSGAQVTFTGVLPGSTTVDLSDSAGRYLPRQVVVVVPAGGTVAAPVELTPAATIGTRVVDAATGQPVAGACAGLAAAGNGRLPDDGAQRCSDASGRISFPHLAPGAYQLFVQPPAGSTLGAQWVGTTGGTGDVATARTVDLAAGRTVEVPTVRLDRAGAVTGVVTSAATGQPVTSGHVSLAADNQGGGTYGTAIDGQGRYRLDRLGPYRWPLLFTTADHAWQWSGSVGERSLAQRVQVRAGQTVTHRQALAVGSVLSGRISNPDGTPGFAELFVHSATTGEVTATGYFGDGTYRLLVLGPKQVKIRWWWVSRWASSTGWYDDDADFAGARSVAVPQQGGVTVDVTVRPA